MGGACAGPLPQPVLGQKRLPCFIENVTNVSVKAKAEPAEATVFSHQLLQRANTQWRSLTLPCPAPALGFFGGVVPLLTGGDLNKVVIVVELDPQPQNSACTAFPSPLFSYQLHGGIKVFQKNHGGSAKQGCQNPYSKNIYNNQA